MPGGPVFKVRKDTAKVNGWQCRFGDSDASRLRGIQKEAPVGRLSNLKCNVPPALHLRSLGDGLAFCCERAVVDATAQAIELHKEPFNGIRPCAFLVGN